MVSNVSVTILSFCGGVPFENGLCFSAFSHIARVVKQDAEEEESEEESEEEEEDENVVRLPFLCRGLDSGSGLRE